MKINHTNEQTENQTKKRMQNVLRLSKRLRPYGVRIAGAIGSGVGNQLTIVGISAVCAYMVGLAIEGRLLSQLSKMILVLILLVAARIFFYFAEMWLAHDVAFKVLADFRIGLFEAIERVAPAILLNMRSGQLASTLMSDVELLEWFFAHTFGSVIVACIVPVILLICLGMIHLLLPVILLAFLLILIWIPVWQQKKADAQGRQVREQLGDANAVTMEGIQGMKEILSLNYLKLYQKKNEAYMSRFYDSQLEYGKRLGTEGALLQAVLAASMLCVAGLSAVLVIHGTIPAAWYPVVVILSGMVLTPVAEVCATARNFGLIFASADRVYRVLESRPLVQDTGSQQDINSILPSVSYKDVVFRYGQELKNAVNGVSFTVYPGETVALVGASGAGKSTCMNLLLRYWDVSEGSICIENCDVRDMTLSNLRDLTSVVLQDVYLFRDTIRQNIRLGRPEATDLEVEEAAKKAFAHEFILALPKGYDTIAGESGAKLSGGQRQRIAIARAFLKNAPILILDEAVSNLDTENEKDIQESIKVSATQKTVLIVAHRLSTIRSADRIVVLKEGQSVQCGTFEELSVQEGAFKELISSQFMQKKVESC